MRSKVEWVRRAMRLAGVVVTVLYLGAAASAARASQPVASWARYITGERYYFFVDRTDDNGFIASGNIVMNYQGYPTIMKVNADGTIAWKKAFVGVSPGNARQTPDGGYIAAGSYSPDGYGKVPMAMKLDASGAIVWQKSYGTFNGNAAYSFSFNTIRPTADGGYIAGGSALGIGAGSNDAFVVKLDANGDIEWQKAYGGSNLELLAQVEQTKDGGYILAASTQSFSPGGMKSWIVKLDATGAIAWQRTFRSASYWRTNYGRVVTETPDNGFAFAASYADTVGGNGRVWVVKLDAAGAIAWQRSYSSGVIDSGVSIDPTSDGGFAVGGNTQYAGNFDYLMLKLDAAGALEWQRSYGGAGYDWFYQVQQTRDGGYVMTGWDGSFTGYLSLLKLDGDGKLSGCASSMMGAPGLTELPVNGASYDTNAAPVDLALPVADLAGTNFDAGPSSRPFCQETGPVISVGARLGRLFISNH